MAASLTSISPDADVESTRYDGMPATITAAD